MNDNTMIAKVTDGIFSIQLTRRAPLSYAVHIKIAGDDNTMDFDVPVVGQVTCSYNGPPWIPYPVKMHDILSAWLGAIDGYLQLALDAQPHTAQTSPGSSYFSRAVSIGDNCSPVSMTVAKALVVAMGDLDARVTPKCKRAPRRRN